MKLSYYLPLALILIICCEVSADDGPIGKDVSIIVTNFSYIIDNVRSESLEAFESDFDSNHGGSYEILVCSKTDPSRLEALLTFMKKHAFSAAVYVYDDNPDEPKVCAESD